MDVKEIREALIKLRDFAKRLDCDYQEECTPGEDDMCESCKHVYIADQAISALSTIDPEAIKREAITQFRMDELDAVMHSVDKWLPDDYPNGINPATRAADAREIAFKAMEAIKRACADAAVKWLNDHPCSHSDLLRAAIIEAAHE